MKAKSRAANPGADGLLIERNASCWTVLVTLELFIICRWDESGRGGGRREGAGGGGDAIHEMWWQTKNNSHDICLKLPKWNAGTRLCLMENSVRPHSAVYANTYNFDVYYFKSCFESILQSYNMIFTTPVFLYVIFAVFNYIETPTSRWEFRSIHTVESVKPVFWNIIRYDEDYIM